MNIYSVGSMKVTHHLGDVDMDKGKYYILILERYRFICLKIGPSGVLL
jgi:hypothetical protein